MRHLFVIALFALPVAACVSPAASDSMNVSQADVARCGYESQSAAAGQTAWGLGGSLDLGLRTRQLNQMCLASASASREAYYAQTACHTVWNPKSGEYDCR